MMTTAIQTTLPTGTWTADPVHSDVSFAVRHMGIGRVRGTFTLRSASAQISDGTTGSVTAVIDTASVNTGNEHRDQHVSSADFLDVDRYPTMEFVSTGVRHFDGKTFTLAGELTLHGVTRPVGLDAEFHGVVDEQAGVRRMGFSATTAISRSAFGVDIEIPFGGGIVVADKIDISIDIEFTSTREAEES